MNSRVSPQAETYIRDGMRIYWDAAIPMDDGVVLRADVFLPLQVGAFPVLMSYGPYAKGLAFQEGFTQAWELMAKETPDRVVGPTNGWAGFSPCRKTPITRHREMLLPTSDLPHQARPIRSETRATLIASIARGRCWLNELVENASANVESIAKRTRSSACARSDRQ